MRRAFCLGPGAASLGGMNGNEVIDLARRTYLEEFARFVAKQSGRFRQGAAEVQTVNSGPTDWFGGHYRVDFIGQQGERPVPVDLIPNDRVRLETPLDGAAGAMRVRMEQIVWDDVEIAHDAPVDLTSRLRLWFEHWYDPEDRRKAADSGGAVDVIHKLAIFPGRLRIDFGSASANAFWALVALLRDAGATQLTISETRPAPPRAN